MYMVDMFKQHIWLYLKITFFDLTQEKKILKISGCTRKTGIPVFNGKILPMIHWKHQITSSFLMLSRGIERDQWHEMNGSTANKSCTIF